MILIRVENLVSVLEVEVEVEVEVETPNKKPSPYHGVSEKFVHSSQQISVTYEQVRKNKWV